MKRIVALGLLLAIGLTACSEEAEPRMGGAETSTSPFAEGPSTTPTHTPSPSASPESAERFLRRWVHAEGQFYATGDSALLRELSTADCGTCDDLIRGVERLYANGGAVEGFNSGQVLSVRRQAPNRYMVKEKLTPYRYRPSANEEWIEVPAETYILRFDLVQHRGQWKVAATYQSDR